MDNNQKSIPLEEQVSIERLKQFYNSTAIKVFSLAAFYNSTNVFDINSYQCRYLSRLLYSIESFIMIVEHNCDLSGATTLARMIIDNTVAFHYLYDTDDEQQRLLRHCLFIIDGLNAKDKLRKRVETGFSQQPQEQNRVQEILQRSDKNREDIIQESLRLLSNHPIKKDDPLLFEKLIRSGEWTFCNYPSTQKNGQFKHKKWETLYQEMGEERVAPDIASFYSQYVHGLAFSNNKAYPIEADFKDPMTEVMQMLRLLDDFLHRKTKKMMTRNVLLVYAKMEDDRRSMTTDAFYQILIKMHHPNR